MVCMGWNLDILSHNLFFVKILDSLTLYICNRPCCVPPTWHLPSDPNTQNLRSVRLPLSPLFSFLLSPFSPFSLISSIPLFFFSLFILLFVSSKISNRNQRIKRDWWHWEGGEVGRHALGRNQNLFAAENRVGFVRKRSSEKQVFFFFFCEWCFVFVRFPKKGIIADTKRKREMIKGHC